jgi:hypothetical protein
LEEVEVEHFLAEEEECSKLVGVEEGFVRTAEGEQ